MSAETAVTYAFISACIAAGALCISLFSLGISGWNAFRAWNRDHREQAELVTAWRAPNADPLDPDAPTYDKLLISNASKLMVYDLIAHTVSIGGTDPRRVALGRPPEEIENLALYVGNVPPGLLESRIPAGEVSHGSRWGVEIAFTDASGRFWLREGRGVLRKLNKPPAELYGDRNVPWSDR
jgi:hypothetical protein